MPDILKYVKIVSILCLMYLSDGVLLGQVTAENSNSACDNYLYISGASNINQFSFSYNAVPRNPKNVADQGDKMEISIPIKDFEASNPMMYKDFLELMKEQEHPWIKIAFSRKQLEKALRDLSEPCPDISITIAGITKSYNVQCLVVMCSDNIYLKGKENIKLSDFKLKPPAKLMGLVKVNNEIDVNFGFIITFTNNNTFSATL